MSVSVPFVARVSKVKTRRKDGRDYFTFRQNIPHEISEKLDLKNGDYMVNPGAMKAKWYHLVNWKEMKMTWEMMPDQLKNEIKSSGLEVPTEEQRQCQPSITTPLLDAVISATSMTWNRDLLYPLKPVV